MSKRGGTVPAALATPGSPSGARR